MGCACSKPSGPLSGTFLPQNQIMSPDLREDIHEELGVALVACSLKGWRKSQEDTSAIVINLGGHRDMLGVGVFDGHSGQEASKYVAANLWNAVTATAEWAAKDIDGALKAAFLAVDASMQREKVCHGTTAVVAVVTPGYLYVANCGDSRAVLCKEGVATAMSTDHKPCDFTEMARVLRCGGQVIPGEFGGVARVTYPGCSVAMATSRSLGDFHFKRNYNSSPSEQVVSPAAEVVCVPRCPGDEFLILGTDGVWDVLTNQEVSDMMRASNRARRPAPEAPPAPPPATLWEDSSAKASASATAKATSASGKGVTSASRELELGGAAQGAGEDGGTQNGEGSLLSSARRINGFTGGEGAAPSTPFHPPVTPHHTAKPPPPFAAAAAAAAATAATATSAAQGGADSYPSSDCGSSDAGSSDAAAETSHVGMDIDGGGGGGNGSGKGASGRGGAKRPAFVRLFTPTLLRLKTPTPPNPIVRAPQRGMAAAAAAATGTAAAAEGAGGGGAGAGGERAGSGGTPPGTVGADAASSGDAGVGVVAGGVEGCARAAANGDSHGGSGGGGIGGSGASERIEPGANAGGSDILGGGSGVAPDLKAGGEACGGGEGVGPADATPAPGPRIGERAEATAVARSGVTATAGAAATSSSSAAAAAAAAAPAAMPVASVPGSTDEGEEEGQGGLGQEQIGGKSSGGQRGVSAAPPETTSTSTAAAAVAAAAAAAAEAANGVREKQDGRAQERSGNAGATGSSCAVSAAQRPPQTCTASDTATAIGTAAAAGTGDDRPISTRGEDSSLSMPSGNSGGGGDGGDGDGSVVDVGDNKPSRVSGKGSGGSWSTTTPPKTPVNQYNSLARGGGGNATATIPETNTSEAAAAAAVASAPAAGAPTSVATTMTPASEDSVGGTVATAAATDESAATAKAGADAGGVTLGARTPGGSSGGGVTPRTRTPGGTGAGGVTPSTRTPGGTSSGGGGGGGGTVGTTPNRLTPASARTPASSRTPGGSSGGAAGVTASACTSVSHTPSRRTSNSRAATPTSRINSYRRSSGSGLNLGLFKSSGSLSVSMSGKGDRSVVGAVQGVLDKALLKGSQDNMTIIAIDLRGLLDASPPDSASSTNM